MADVDHELVRHDLSAIDAGARWELGLRLSEAGITYAWTDDDVLVGSSAVDPFVEDALSQSPTLTTATGPAEEWETPFDDPTDEDDLEAAPVIASPWRRLVGYLVDELLVGLILGVWFFSARRVSPSASPPVAAPLLVWLRVGVGAAYEIVAIGGFDRTIGQAVVRLRVTDVDGASPGFRRAVIRWLVLAPALLGTLFPLLVLHHTRWTSATTSRSWYVDLFGFWALIVYVPVWFDHLHRGLHDRAAGTLVVTWRSRRRGPRR